MNVSLIVFFALVALSNGAAPYRYDPPKGLVLSEEPVDFTIDTTQPQRYAVIYNNEENSEPAATIPKPATTQHILATKMKLPQISQQDPPGGFIPGGFPGFLQPNQGFEGQPFPGFPTPNAQGLPGLAALQGFNAQNIYGFLGQNPLGFPGQNPQGFLGQNLQGFPGQNPQGFFGQNLQGFPGQNLQGFLGQGLQGLPGFPTQGAGNFPGQNFGIPNIPNPGLSQGFPSQGLFPAGGFVGPNLPQRFVTGPVFASPTPAAAPVPTAEPASIDIRIEPNKGEVASDTIYGANGGYVYEKP